MAVLADRATPGAGASGGAFGQCLPDLITVTIVRFSRSARPARPEAQTEILKHPMRCVVHLARDCYFRRSAFGKRCYGGDKGVIGSNTAPCSLINASTVLRSSRNALHAPTTN